jgi:RNA polymerase sigma-70 factor (sigma-E family)
LRNVSIRRALLLRIGTGVGGDPVNAPSLEDTVLGEAVAVDGAAAPGSTTAGLDSAPVPDGAADLDDSSRPDGVSVLASTAILGSVPPLDHAGLLDGSLLVPDHAQTVAVAVTTADGVHHDVAGDADAKEDTGDVTENFCVTGEPAGSAARPTDVTETLAPNALLPEVIAPEAFTSRERTASAVWDADDIVTEIYSGHYNQLVRLALLLVHDVQTAEEVVQDAFEAMHLAWRRLRDSEKALSYLRQTVVNRSRSVLRHRKVVDMHAPKPAPDEPSAEHAALTLLERSAVAAALRMLPQRQREAIVLRYYADFSEADIANAMGISRGAVKSHTARAMASLKSILEQETS